MPADFLSGTWIFDPGSSQLTSPPPLEWVQGVQIEGGRIRVQERITRASGTATVEVDAALDGEFYEVRGSPVADEISYILEGDSIHGTGRKNGAVLFREVIRSLVPDQMTLTMVLLINGKEVPLGTARFLRKQ